MKFSEAWLREWINPNISSADLGQQLTMAGLEIAGIEPAAPDFANVVVAEITAIEQHPDADKLRVCQVNAGDEEALQIVCGAPNVTVGMKAPLIKIGGYLSADDGKPFKIKRSKLRGVESFGMLCSAKELGLAEDADGLLELPHDAPIGQDIREYYQLDDQIFEVELTPNRGDCLSIRGIAREVAALNALDFKDLVTQVTKIAAVNTDSIPVEIEAKDACLGFTGRVMRNINVTDARTPLWMKEKLRRAGLRPIHPVVDISNYVMLETGQPTHTFDLRVIEKGIKVRFARPDEELTLLDGKEVELLKETLVIADHKKALAIAGIMGGEHSGIKDDTRDVFIECAHFTPLYIAGKARSYGLHTDASHRFERGVDAQLMVPVVERITQLMLDIVGGEPGPLQFTQNDNNIAQSPENTPIIYQKDELLVTHEQIESLLGLDLSERQVLAALNGLGIVTKTHGESYSAQIPSHRFDINIPEDLIEEVGRIYGLSKIESVPLSTAARLKLKRERALSSRLLKDALVNRGYFESISYSFISTELHELFGGSEQPIKLANPISNELLIMRESLLPSLLQTLVFNNKRQATAVKLLEVGSRYSLQATDIKEEKIISCISFGTANSHDWRSESSSSDFYNFKADIESLFALANKTVAFEAYESEILHPGQAAKLSLKTIENESNLYGIIGQLHPAIQKRLGLDRPVYVAEIPVSLLSTRELPQYSAVSAFPSSRRDLSLLVPNDVSGQELIDVCLDVDSGFLVNAFIFDLYVGDSLETGQKSIGLGLIFQEKSRTLTDEEVDADVELISQSLSTKLNAQLRS